MNLPRTGALLVGAAMFRIRPYVNDNMHKHQQTSHSTPTTDKEGTILIMTSQMNASNAASSSSMEGRRAIVA